MNASAQTASGFWQVFDRNQKGPNEPPRIHEAGGHSWPLFRDQPCPMPPHVAAVFLRDPAFRVLDEAGEQMLTLPSSENLDAARRRPNLERGETVAKFEELTHTALLARAVLRAGGEQFTRQTKRDALVAFLTDAPAISELREHEKARSTGGEAGIVPGGEEMDDADALKMLQGG